MKSVHEQELRALSLELGRWRKGCQSPGGRIPERFWVRAVALARLTSIEQVCGSLRLSASGLEKRLGTKGKSGSNQRRKGPTFVELLVESPTAFSPAESASGSTCVIKVEAVSGARMQVEVTNLGASGLATVLREFSS